MFENSRRRSFRKLKMRPKCSTVRNFVTENLVLFLISETTCKVFDVYFRTFCIHRSTGNETVTTEVLLLIQMGSRAAPVGERYSKESSEIQIQTEWDINHFTQPSGKLFGWSGRKILDKQWEREKSR